MREAWCVFTEIIENRKSDSTCTSCVMRDVYSFLGSRIHRFGSGQHASREPTMTSFYGFSRVPPKILACDPGTTTFWPICTLHSLFLLFVLLLWWLLYSAVIDDTYLEKLINLVEEHPALYNTYLKEYKGIIRIGNIWDSIAEARDVETLIFR